jgi:hypothetical protein
MHGFERKNDVRIGAGGTSMEIGDETVTTSIGDTAFASIPASGAMSGRQKSSEVQSRYVLRSSWRLMDL